MLTNSALAAVLSRATDAGDVPGVAVCIANRDGVIYDAAFGQRSLATGVAMTTDTVCWIASMTKAVTAAAAMQLVEQGKLTLDDPIERVLPELGRVPVLEGFDAAGVARLRAPKTKMTLRHLLTHTSGFTYDMFSADMARYQKANTIPGVASCKNVALTTPLLFDPGERWAYGISIDWVGKVVEAVSGLTLGATMKSNIFDPLGMTETGFKIRDDQRQRLAAIHIRKPAGLVATSIELPAEPEFEMGGGGLYSTVGDYMKFARMILNGGVLDGRRLLKAETVAAMSTHAMGAIRARALKSADLGATRDMDFTEGMEWGLSFMINPQPLATGRSAGSLAWAGLANTYYWIDPAKGIAGIFAAQVFPFAEAQVLALFQAFETEVYRAL